MSHGTEESIWRNLWKLENGGHNNPVITHFRPYEAVATVTNTPCPGTITLHEWPLSCEHSHLLGAVTFYHHLSPKPCSRSKCFSQPHSTHPKVNYRKFISFLYLFVLLLNRSLEMAQLAPAQGLKEELGVSQNCFKPQLKSCDLQDRCPWTITFYKPHFFICKLGVIIILT